MSEAIDLLANVSVKESAGKEDLVERLMDAADHGRMHRICSFGALGWQLAHGKGVFATRMSAFENIRRSPSAI